MPLLGGIFHRRHVPARHVSSGGPSTASVASSVSNKDSTDGDYVLPDRPPQPIYNLPAIASSSKLKLPFRRKAVPPPQLDPRGPPHPLLPPKDAPTPPYIASVTSDSGHSLPPPPRKSSLFAAHNGSLPSVHSFSNESSNHGHPDTPSSLDARSESYSLPATQPHKKSPGLFSWARERTKSKPLSPSSISSSTPSTRPSVDDASSFNLKSFRHVRADSPVIRPQNSPPPPPSSDPLPPPPRPRPREDSIASDGSQRISIAAFREAQARSRANSPVPSFRPPSAADTLRVDGNGRQRASTVSVVSGNDRPPSTRNTVGTPSSTRSDVPAPVASSDSSESEEDHQADKDSEPIPNPGWRRTATHRVNELRARSDIGHNAGPISMDQRTSSGQQDPNPKSAPPLAYRSRASVSTSALTPSGAARRASVLAATNSSPNSYTSSMHAPRNLKHNTDESTDSEDTDSEDMPLSGLVAPRRPGSSTSNYSNSRPRMPPKPLIDIKSLAGAPPLLTPILRHEDSIKKISTHSKEQYIGKDQPFSIPAALALSSSTSPPISPPANTPSSPPTNRPASTAHHRRSSSNTSIPGPGNDDDLMNAIRLVSALNSELDEPSSVPEPPTKSPHRIMPTPIREREPPTSFTVLSRPPQRQSISDTSSSLLPTPPTRFSITRPTLSSRPEIGTRQRAPSMGNPTVQHDRSDTMSVSSAVKPSTSRTSVPLVPLIHSVPDSPSVQEDYRPSRPHSASRTSGISASKDRSQPMPTKLVSATPSSIPNKMPSHGFRSSSMPQRPFASNNFTRGESPAGSSTGDSSSGRAPFTPRDGSDIGVRSKDDVSDLGSTLKARGHAKKPSVTFEDSQSVRGRERVKTDLSSEEKTRERRRSEAKAAIELGKIVNGRGPLVHDDSDDNMRPHERNPAIHVTMENGAHGMMQPGWMPWQQPMASGMTPMVPSQFGHDPAYLAAHQQALLFAKQAYQMAVAQHAMQVAGEEWERSSNAGFGGGSSVYGGGSGGGSVYGGGSGGSVYGGVGGMGPIGMMSMPNMGMLMPPNQWGRSSVAFPTSVYGGISSSQSEYGGAGGWGTQSVYGDSFGPSTSRTSYVGNSAPNSSASAYEGSSRPRAWTGVPPSSASTSSGQPTRSTGKGPARSRAAPPSSWKSSR